MQSAIRLIVFDLDGTLIDSRRDLTNAVNALLVQCGAAELSEDRVGGMIGDGAATLVSRAFEASGIAKPDDALARFLAIYADHLTDYTQPYDGITDVLSTLGEGKTLAVLTNKPLASTRVILERLGLERFFASSLVLGGDGPFPRKPEPAGLQWLMQATRVNSHQTLMVGDSPIDLRTARNAGVRVAVARYGFGFEGFLAARLDPGDFQVDSPRGLLCL